MSLNYCIINQNRRENEAKSQHRKGNNKVPGEIKKKTEMQWRNHSWFSVKNKNKDKSLGKLIKNKKKEWGRHKLKGYQE